MIKIYIASDHAGIDVKNRIVHWLRDQQSESKQSIGKQLQVTDLGPSTTDSVDYPDFADLVCKNLKSISLVQTDSTAAPSYPNEIGILICGSGQGMAMRANKFQHIRAALCNTEELAKLSREHNNANVLCLGARTTTENLLYKIVTLFLTTDFAGGRHQQRVVKVNTPIG